MSDGDSDVTKGNKRSKDQEKVFHAPLHPLDTEKQTYGCRHTNPDICAKNEMLGICAFVRHDGICGSPPASWSKQFVKLTQLASEDVK